MKNRNKNAMSLVAILIALLFVVGCKQQIIPSNEEVQAMKDLRISLFKECMSLLPEGPKETVYNDWDEVVSECGSQAYYMSR